MSIHLAGTTHLCAFCYSKGWQFLASCLPGLPPRCQFASQSAVLQLPGPDVFGSKPEVKSSFLRYPPAAHRSAKICCVHVCLWFCNPRWAASTSAPACQLLSGQCTRRSQEGSVNMAKKDTHHRAGPNGCLQHTSTGRGSHKQRHSWVPFAP